MTFRLTQFEISILRWYRELWKVKQRYDNYQHKKRTRIW